MHIFGPPRVSDIIEDKTSQERFRIIDIRPLTDWFVLITAVGLVTFARRRYPTHIDANGSIAPDAPIAAVAQTGKAPPVDLRRGIDVADMAPSEVEAIKRRIKRGSDNLMSRRAVVGTPEARWEQFKQRAAEYIAKNKQYRSVDVQDVMDRLEQLRKQYGNEGLAQMGDDLGNKGFHPAFPDLTYSGLDRVGGKVRRAKWVARRSVGALTSPKLSDQAASEVIIRWGGQYLSSTPDVLKTHPTVGVPLHPDEIILAAREGAIHRYPELYTPTEETVEALRTANRFLSEESRAFKDIQLNPAGNAERMLFPSRSGGDRLRRLLGRPAKERATQPEFLELRAQFQAASQHYMSAGQPEIAQKIDDAATALDQILDPAVTLKAGAPRTEVLQKVRVAREYIRGFHKVQKGFYETRYQNPMDILDELIGELQQKLPPVLTTEEMGLGEAEETAFEARKQAAGILDDSTNDLRRIKQVLEHGSGRMSALAVQRARAEGKALGITIVRDPKTGITHAYSDRILQGLRAWQERGGGPWKIAAYDEVIGRKVPYSVVDVSKAGNIVLELPALPKAEELVVLTTAQTPSELYEKTVKTFERMASQLDKSKLPARDFLNQLKGVVEDFKPNLGLEIALGGDKVNLETAARAVGLISKDTTMESIRGGLGWASIYENMPTPKALSRMLDQLPQWVQTRFGKEGSELAWSDIYSAAMRALQEIAERGPSSFVNAGELEQRIIALMNQNAGKYFRKPNVDFQLLEDIFGEEGARRALEGMGMEAADIAEATAESDIAPADVRATLGGGLVINPRAEARVGRFTDAFEIAELARDQANLEAEAHELHKLIHEGRVDEALILLNSKPVPPQMENRVVSSMSYLAKQSQRANWAPSLEEVRQIIRPWAAPNLEDSVDYFLGEAEGIAKQNVRDTLQMVAHIEKDINGLKKEMKKLYNATVGHGLHLTPNQQDKARALQEAIEDRQATVAALNQRAAGIAEVIPHREATKAEVTAVKTFGTKPGYAEQRGLIEYYAIQNEMRIGIPYQRLAHPEDLVEVSRGVMRGAFQRTPEGQALLYHPSTDKFYALLGERRVQEWDPVAGELVGPVLTHHGVPERMARALEASDVSWYGNILAAQDPRELLRHKTPMSIYEVPEEMGGGAFATTLNPEQLAARTKAYDTLHQTREGMFLDMEWDPVSKEIHNIALKRYGRPGTPGAGEVLLDIANRNKVSKVERASRYGHIPEAGWVATEEEMLGQLSNKLASNAGIPILTRGTEDQAVLQMAIKRAINLGIDPVQIEALSAVAERNLDTLAISQMVNRAAQSHSLENVINQFGLMKAIWVQPHAASPDNEAEERATTAALDQLEPGGFSKLTAGATRREVKEGAYFLRTTGVGRGKAFKLHGVVSAEGARNVVGNAPDVGWSIIMSDIYATGKEGPMYAKPVAGEAGVLREIMGAKAYESVGDVLIDYNQYTQDLARRGIRRALDAPESGLGRYHLFQLAELRAANAEVFGHTVEVLRAQQTQTFLENLEVYAGGNAEAEAGVRAEASRIFEQAFTQIDDPGGQAVLKDISPEMRPYVLRELQRQDERLWEQRLAGKNFWNTDFQIHRDFYEQLVKGETVAFKGLNKAQKNLVLQAYHKRILAQGWDFPRVTKDLPAELVPNITLELPGLGKVIVGAQDTTTESLRSKAVSTARGILLSDAETTEKERLLATLGQDTVDYLNQYRNRLPSTEVADRITNAVLDQVVIPNMRKQDWWEAATKGREIDAANLSQNLRQMLADMPGAAGDEHRASFFDYLEGQTTPESVEQFAKVAKGAQRRMGRSDIVSEIVNAGGGGPSKYAFGSSMYLTDPWTGRMVEGRERNLLMQGGFPPGNLTVQGAIELDKEKALAMYSKMLTDPMYRSQLAYNIGEEKATNVVNEMLLAMGYTAPKAGATPTDVREMLKNVTIPVDVGKGNVAKAGQTIGELADSDGGVRKLQILTQNTENIPPEIQDSISRAYGFPMGMGGVGGAGASVFEGLKLPTSPLNSTTAEITRGLQGGFANGLLGRARSAGLVMLAFGMFEAMRPLNLDKKQPIEQVEPQPEPGSNLTYRQQPVFSNYSIHVDAMGRPGASYDDAVDAIKSALGSHYTHGQVDHQTDINDQRSQMDRNFMDQLANQLSSIAPYRPIGEGQPGIWH